MKAAIVAVVLCVVASILGGIHQMVCDQRPETTTGCDVAFGVPVVVALAVACGVSGLVLLAMTNSGNGKAA